MTGQAPLSIEHLAMLEYKHTAKYLYKLLDDFDSYSFHDAEYQGSPLAERAEAALNLYRAELGQ